ncbi:hypothetical protein AX17_005965 [Amanita inopinata Kibby_2008]|nr:hypothetical protein AX17_005965 [Amanita inopinata Kibby_2008]
MIISRPVQKTLPLPPYTYLIAIVYTRYDRCLTFSLWKNGKSLTIQVPPPPVHEALKEHLAAEARELQQLTRSIVFGKTNWAYFVRDKHGKRTLAYRQRTLYEIKYPPYAPLVPESEITYTRPVGGHIREGIWNGQEVDVWVGWNDFYMTKLEEQMRAYDLLRGLDVTYDVIAHVVDSQGRIIGMLTEPAFARPFEYRDLPAIGEAMSKIINRGLYYSLSTWNICMSLDNKVRFTSVYSVRKFRPGEKEFEVQRHQKRMQEWYLTLKGIRKLLSSSRYELLVPALLNGLPDINRTIGLVFVNSIIARETFAMSSHGNVPMSANRLSYRVAGSNHSTIPLANTTGIEEVEEDPNKDGDDAPLVPSRRENKHRSGTWHPYHKSSRKSKKLLLAPE